MRFRPMQDAAGAEHFVVAMVCNFREGASHYKHPFAAVWLIFNRVFDRIAACSKRCALRKGGAHTRALRGSLGRYYNIDEVGEVGCRN